jgi:hypothetical protein
MKAVGQLVVMVSLLGGIGMSFLNSGATQVVVQSVSVEPPAIMTLNTPTATSTPAGGDCQDTHCGEAPSIVTLNTPTATPTPVGGDCQDTHCGEAP